MTLSFEEIKIKIDEINKQLENNFLTEKEIESFENKRDKYEDYYNEILNERIDDINQKLENTNLNENEKIILEEEKLKYEDELFDNDYTNEEEEEEEEDIQYELIHFKYWFEGCKTIDEVLCGIESLKENFEELKKEGHELTQEVNNGYCFIDKIYTDEEKKNE